jgi:hypothetical protein
MKRYFYLFVTVVLCICNKAFSQGCVAVKNMASCPAFMDSASTTKWQVSLNYRYFKSFRHFTGKEEDKERIEEHTNVINHDNSVILGLSYQINHRLSASISLPYVYVDRSSRPRDEHGERVPERHYVTSTGIGDLRLSAYYAIVPQQPKGNLTVGLGVKLPTGNFNFKDDAFVNGAFVERPVDQSIQPGDGGVGAIVEADFSKLIAPKTYWYTNGMYLFNARNTNGTKTNRSNPFEDVMSVADQYFLRTGARYIHKHIIASVGGRLEGIPVKDLIGKSDGFRRPGYIVSVEPAFFYTFGKHTAGVNVPIAVMRNRTKSVADQRFETQEGKPQHGDAAFADYLLSFTYAYKW